MENAVMKHLFTVLAASVAFLILKVETVHADLAPIPDVMGGGGFPLIPVILVILVVIVAVFLLRKFKK